MSDAAASFEPHGRYLAGIAYRMLGSVAEAEDVVQDAFLRWDAADRAAVHEPRAYLARIVSRLCLDRMKSARAQREKYVGTWLPEPLLEPAAHDPASLAEDLSIALLMTLERLSPLERAAFLMHDVFDIDYAEIADMLERSEAACRQLTARAREHVRDDRPRYPTDPATRERLVGAFMTAAFGGNVAALTDLLAEQAVMYSDGGGKRPAAPAPIHGRDAIVAFFTKLATQPWSRIAPEQMQRVDINALPGFIVQAHDGVQTVAFELAGDQIVAIYIVRNPDKLRHLA